MKDFKKLFYVSTALTANVLCSCANINKETKSVGILFPNKTNERYIYDAKNLSNYIESFGYKTILQYANDDIENQIAQVENMVCLGVDCLVIFAIDSIALCGVEKLAAKNNIPIFAYDRLLMETENIDYYYTFDNFQVGVTQASYVERVADLKSIQQKGEHKTIEIFAGAQSDNNAKMFYDGQMSVLEPYLKDGTLVCRTGRTEFASCSILDWSQANCMNACENYLAGFYPNRDLDICLCSADSLALGVISALDGAGFTKENWPIITGQDAETVSIKNIIAEKQSMTIYKDGQVSCLKLAEGIDLLFRGEKVPVNDTTSYHNGAKFIDSYLCPVIEVTIENYYEILVETGFYTEEQLGLKK